MPVLTFLLSKIVSYCPKLVEYCSGCCQGLSSWYLCLVIGEICGIMFWLLYEYHKYDKNHVDLWGKNDDTF